MTAVRGGERSEDDYNGEVLPDMEQNQSQTGLEDVIEEKSPTRPRIGDFHG